MHYRRSGELPPAISPTAATPAYHSSLLPRQVCCDGPTECSLCSRLAFLMSHRDTAPSTRQKSLSTISGFSLDRHGSETRWSEGECGLCADISANRSSRQGHGYRPVEGLSGHSDRGVQYEGWQVGNRYVIRCSNVLTCLVGI